ncbi:response regulator [uncultured Massilia sp.]|uniref:response regulator n=1 Tax=uncultured Massilia sp. TaxID=169973 RepID=UPI002582C2D4|nr:response regulator [uncultured Massilia sp.]
MATGQDKDEHLDSPLDVQGDGQSAGVHARGEVEGNSVTPTGGPGINHWQASYIGAPGLDDRGNIFFAAVEMTRMPMVVTDPNQEDNPIVFVNGAFLDLTGYKEEEVLGRNCRFLQGPDSDRATVAEVRKALEEQRAVSVDLLNYKADGEAFWNALFIGPIFDQHGKLLYFFASQMDITERRSALESNLQAQKMEAIGQLSAGMAHDFNNLLQVINGNLELANLTAGKTPAAEPIRRAQRATMQAGKLTQQLLSFARKQRLEQKPISLNSLVMEFSDMLVRTLGKEVELRLDLRPGLPTCSLDPTYLEMALLNVVINARDAMPQGGVVTVGTSVVSEARRGANRLPPGDYVSVCIADEGEGMTPDVAKRATEPFFTTKGLGTGLGLAMVHGFVQQSQGRLEIDSEPGQGTRVRMMFPVARHEARDEDGGTDLASLADAAGRKCRILVVEDNPDVRELAEAMLAAADYEVVSAPSGETALALLQRESVDLLFTDVIMPGGMNGLQLIEQVHATTPSMPVLVTTGYMDELPARGSKGQALEVLAKPYDHQELLDRVHAALHGRRAA